jgi:hypothetical protein
VELVRLRILRVRAGVVDPLTVFLLVSSLPGKALESVEGDEGVEGEAGTSDGSSKGRLGCGRCICTSSSRVSDIARLEAKKWAVQDDEKKRESSLMGAKFAVVREVQGPIDGRTW